MKYLRHAPLLFWTALLTAGIALLIVFASLGEDTDTSDLAAVAAVSVEPSHAIATRAQMEQFPALVSADDLAPLSRLAARIGVRAELAADRRVAAYGPSDALAARYLDVTKAAENLVAVTAFGNHGEVVLATARLGNAGDVLVQAALGPADVAPIIEYDLSSDDMWVPTPHVDEYNAPSRSGLPSHEELRDRLG